MMLRYESFVNDPASWVRRVFGFVGVPAPEVVASVAPSGPLADYEPVLLHTLGGNRIRFERGTVTVRADEEWRGSMGRWPRLVVTIMTLPLLVAYGYVGRRKEG